MVQTHREKAYDFKKKGYDMSCSANLPKFKNTIKSQKYLNQASELYEKAGDEWILQAKEKENLRDTRNSLSYAVNNYNSAKKLAGSENEKKRIQNKKNSIDTTMNSLIPIKGLQRKLSFAILAIISFVVALFFISFNLTGYIILGQAKNNLGFFAAAFFVLGLVFVFFYSKNKK